MRKLAKRSICTLLFTIVMLELIAIAKRFFRVLSSEFCRVWKGSVVHFWEAIGPPAKRFGSRKSCWNVICTKQLSLIIAGSGAYQLLFRTSRSEREREREGDTGCLDRPQVCVWPLYSISISLLTLFHTFQFFTFTWLFPHTKRE